MSRIGRLPVEIPAGVTVTVDANNLVKVKGPLGELSQQVVKDGSIKTSNKTFAAPLYCFSTGIIAQPSVID